MFFMCKVYGRFMLFDVQGMQVFYVQDMWSLYVHGMPCFFYVQGM